MGGGGRGREGEAADSALLNWYSCTASKWRLDQGFQGEEDDSKEACSTVSFQLFFCLCWSQKTIYKCSLSMLIITTWLLPMLKIRLWGRTELHKCLVQHKYACTFLYSEIPNCQKMLQRASPTLEFARKYILNFLLACKFDQILKRLCTWSKTSIAAESTSHISIHSSHFWALYIKVRGLKSCMGKGSSTLYVLNYCLAHINMERMLYKTYILNPSFAIKTCLEKKTVGLGQRSLAWQLVIAKV